ncbi:Yip1-domain-containing protein [Lentinula edodes]|uniref:Yip1-domain-containing protein n=2 Tax=Lentinula TaxID=5352 RepID=A0ACC1TWI9_9AGAR|nr:Yip1-domain-containing protein [Lentinula edodes]KAJ3808988.1 Yip1-domain-containing protein [Lentinula aff. lateritia]KAJ3856233.1 Yip1-domain-containing protein [Lentinula lateritia]KAH7874741.1 Yip1-domain-containing protein [Lentinula edodes]KAJ3883550.1 Yip1-domain-containing protein [Lentinula edodes]KAJ3896865.1 Yip1-domain-containing protein [Lentinula edodes]
MWQDIDNSYSSSSTQNAYYPQQNQATPLQFYSPGAADPAFYPGSRPSLDGNMAPVAQGNIAQGGPTYGGNIQPAGGWWTAFGTGGFEGEPPLLEELGINFSHIRAKTLTVLNPFSQVDERIMDDADLAGPIIFVFCFGIFLLFSGKQNFGYIYGVGLLGSISIYTLLNLMAEKAIDAYRVTSVLGYCLLPMVGVGGISVAMTLDGLFGYVLSLVSIIWCTYSASGIFVAVLRMSDQRLLVAYPVGLLYGCFALMSVFSGK